VWAGSAHEPNAQARAKHLAQRAQEMYSITTRDVHVTVDAVVTFYNTVRILWLKSVNYGVNRKKTLYTAV